MKKLLSLVLALCMALALLPAMAESADVTGAWYAAKVGDGENFVDIAMLGIQMVLTLNEDGTATMDTTGVDLQKGTWEAKDGGVVVTIDDQPVEGTIADGELTMAATGQVIIFTREAPKAVEFAEVKSDATVEEFNGTYEIAYLANGDSYLDSAAIAMAGLVLPKITIENGVLTAENLDDDTIGIGTMMNLFSGDTMELKDGRLVAELSVEGVDGSNGINVALLQDGMLWLELFSNGESVFNMYYTLVKAE